MTIDEINDEIDHMVANDEKVGGISDGYHTFDELYDHRCTLWAVLLNVLDKREKNAGGHRFAWKSKTHSDGSVMEGWFVAGYGMAKGIQMTYHLPLSMWDEVRVTELDKAPEWDKHSSADVLERMKRLFL